MFHTLFIGSTGLFYALFLSNQTARRAELLLSAYAVSCVLASVIAVTTWLSAFDGSGDWVKDGRAMAPFKDPNVLGSYMVTGAPLPHPAPAARPFPLLVAGRPEPRR